MGDARASLLPQSHQHLLSPLLAGLLRLARCPPVSEEKTKPTALYCPSPQALRGGLGPVCPLEQAPCTVLFSEQHQETIDLRLHAEPVKERFTHSYGLLSPTGSNADRSPSSKNLEEGMAKIFGKYLPPVERLLLVPGRPPDDLSAALMGREVLCTEAGTSSLSGRQAGRQIP